MAALPASHAAILAERTSALMIDSTRRMVVELSAIDARAAGHRGSGYEQPPPLATLITVDGVGLSKPSTTRAKANCARRAGGPVAWASTSTWSASRACPRDPPRPPPRRPRAVGRRPALLSPPPGPARCCRFDVLTDDALGDLRTRIARDVRRERRTRR